MPVDANVTPFAKVSAEVQRQARYDVEVRADGSARATFSVSYANPVVRPSPRYGASADFGTYLRVYAPRGARLRSAEGFADDVAGSEERGFAVFGGYVHVPPGQRRAIRLTYELPAGTTWRPAGGYELRVQKQPGVASYPLDVQVRLPGGKTARATSAFVADVQIHLGHG
jgi:hypothetical protein